MKIDQRDLPQKQYWQYGLYKQKQTKTHTKHFKVHIATEQIPTYNLLSIAFLNNLNTPLIWTLKVLLFMEKGKIQIVVTRDMAVKKNKKHCKSPHYCKTNPITTAHNNSHQHKNRWNGHQWSKYRQYGWYQKKKKNSIIGKPALPSQISPFILVPVSTSHNTNNMIEYCSYSILQRQWPTLYTIMIIVCIAMNGCKFPSPLLCFL